MPTASQRSPHNVGDRDGCAPVEPTISICICTFKRLAMLRGLLESIARNLRANVPCEVVVVDNDHAASAREIAESPMSSAMPVRYFVEPEQNISRARNRCVLEARGDWLAMIDDDEIPEPEWLIDLYGCALELDADAVFGPVKPIYAPNCPRWIIDGGFFEKGHASTGTPVATGQARTSNVLLRRDLVASMDEPFNPDFGLSGGEDSFLFEGLLLDGSRLFWCDGGTVSENVPPERATWQWLLRRAFRGGQTHGRLILSGYGRRRTTIFTRLHLLVGSLARLCFATGAAVLCLPFGKIARFRWLLKVALQIGKITALTPFTYREYAR